MFQLEVFWVVYFLRYPATTIHNPEDLVLIVVISSKNRHRSAIQYTEDEAEIKSSLFSAYFRPPQKYIAMNGQLHTPVALPPRRSPRQPHHTCLDEPYSWLLSTNEVDAPDNTRIHHWT
jgi:hypothetical protein